ncbi:SDR family oxidoreductase [Bradyrhizobium sp. USDA 4451]
MQTVFVTGANRGLGLEFVRQYRQAGWHVIAACRRPKEAFQARDWGAELLELDVQDDRAIRALPQTLRDYKIDLLINNAGYHSGYAPLGSLDYSTWQTAFHINVIAPLQVAEALLPLIPNGAKIVNIGSRRGSNGCNLDGGVYLYRATKAALHSITRSMAMDLATRDIVVVALHPGWVKTDMGTSGAEIDVEESVSGMRNVIANLASHNTGRLFNYDGSELPW